jgi:acyl-CoA thioesterase FadM
MTTLPYFIDQTVRVSDLNYGQHVGIAEMHRLAHQARISFLSSLGYTERDIGGVGFLAVESHIELLSESVLGDLLRFQVKIEIFSKAQFKSRVSIVDPQTGKAVASVEDRLVCYDFMRKRPAAVPEEFAARFR